MPVDVNIPVRCFYFLLQSFLRKNKPARGQKGEVNLSNLEPERKYKPAGKARDLFDKKAVGKFQSDLYNLPFLRDQAVKRNKWYLLIIALLVVALVYICMTAKFKTYVVRVNETTGEVTAGQEIKARAYEPRQAEIAFFLRQFIRDTRSVPSDMVVLRKNWERASHYLTLDAAKKYNGLVMKEGRTLDNIRGRMIEPTINTLQLQPGMDRTYQIRWVEEDYSQDGNLLRASYSGLFSIKVEPPDKEQELAINPLGLKISDLTYAKENETVVKKMQGEAAAPKQLAPAPAPEQ